MTKKQRETPNGTLVDEEPTTRRLTDGDPKQGTPEQPAVREWISKASSVVEDVVYVGLGLIPAGSAMVLLVDGALSFGRSMLAGALVNDVVNLIYRSPIHWIPAFAGMTFWSLRAQ